MRKAAKYRGAVNTINKESSVSSTKMNGSKHQSNQISNGGIDTLLSSNSSSSIQKRIEFVKGTRPDLEWEKLKNKYTPINAQVNKENAAQTASKHFACVIIDEFSFSESMRVHIMHLFMIKLEKLFKFV